MRHRRTSMFFLRLGSSVGMHGSLQFFAFGLPSLFTSMFLGAWVAQWPCFVFVAFCAQAAQLCVVFSALRNTLGAFFGAWGPISAQFGALEGAWGAIWTRCAM